MQTSASVRESENRNTGPNHHHTTLFKVPHTLFNYTNIRKCALSNACTGKSTYSSVWMDVTKLITELDGFNDANKDGGGENAFTETESRLWVIYEPN